MINKVSTDNYECLTDELKKVADKFSEEYDRGYDYISNGKKILNYLVVERKIRHLSFTSFEEDHNKYAYSVVGMLLDRSDGFQEGLPDFCK